MDDMDYVKDEKATGDSAFPELVMSPSSDIETYVSGYAGRAKILRLIFIAERCPPLAQDAYSMALQEVKNGVDTTLYEEIYSAYSSLLASLGSKSHVEDDRQWVQMTLKKSQQQYEKLDIELKGYRNNLIKESIRIGHNDLGDFHYQRGELNQALKCYSRTRDYCTTSRHIIQMCLNIIKISVELGNWSHVLSFVSKAESAPDLQDDPSVVCKLKYYSGLAFIAFRKYKQAAQCFLEGSQDQNVNLPEIMTSRDVGLYGGLCALATLNRSELHQKVISNTTFKQYLELIPELRELILDFHASRYKSCLSYLETLKSEILIDIILAEHASEIFQMIRNRALIQYFSPYLSIDLRKMASDLNISFSDLEKELTKLIMDGMIAARIDSHNKVIYARKTDQRTSTFIKCIEMGDNFKRQLELSLLQVSLKRNNFFISANHGREEKIPYNPT